MVETIRIMLGFGMTIAIILFIVFTASCIFFIWKIYLKIKAAFFLFDRGKKIVNRCFNTTEKYLDIADDCANTGKKLLNRTKATANGYLDVADDAAKSGRKIIKKGRLTIDAFLDSVDPLTDD